MKKIIIIIAILWIVPLLCILLFGQSKLKPLVFEYHNIKGIGYEKGVTRRDPSDIICVNDIYYVYYTKVYGKGSGYWGTIWYAISSDGGVTWQEKGEVLGKGKNNNFDSFAVFTPNIIKADEKYYLFYTGVKATPGLDTVMFENNSITDITAIGCAVSKSPDGPFKRVDTEPVLKVSVEPEKFDSYRVDDAAMLYRNNKYWLYYKGRSRIHGKHGPGKTQMGVAFAKNPEGPYRKYGQPILSKSHEVMIWPFNEGVAALASISSTLEYAPDGIDFMSDKKSILIKSKRPNAPGAYRPDLTGQESKGLNWGISMIHNGAECYLIRYECNEF